MHAFRTRTELIAQRGAPTSIADDLNRRGFQTHEGKKWTTLTVYQLFLPSKDQCPFLLYEQSENREHRGNHQEAETERV